MTKEEIKETTKLRLSGAYFFKTEFRTYIDMDSHLLRLDQTRKSEREKTMSKFKSVVNLETWERIERELLGVKEE